MCEILFSLVDNIVIEAFHLPVDYFGVGKLWIRLLVGMDALLVLLMERFLIDLTVKVIGELRLM